MNNLSEKQRIRIDSSKTHNVWWLINDLLNNPEYEDKGDYISEYLIGATLYRRFPNEEILSYENGAERCKGIYFLGDTIFYVSMKANPDFGEKCSRNINDGYKVYLIVPERSRQGINQLADLYDLSDGVSITSIESFVSMIIEWTSCFSKSKQVESLS